MLHRALPLLLMAIIGLARPSHLRADGSTSSRTLDIVFVIDGSESLDDGGLVSPWKLQKQGIKECLIGPYAFIPHDGTVAVGVIQFARIAVTEIPLTVIDDDGPEGISATAFNELVNDIQY